MQRLGGLGLGRSKVFSFITFSILTLADRCAADLIVETEIRETMVKNFEEMPSEYWNTPQSLSKVFFMIFTFSRSTHGDLSRSLLKLLAGAEVQQERPNPPTMSSSG